MGIKFACPACGRSLNVKSELAGKRGRCPHCQGKIEIPAESLTPSAASVTAAPGATPAGSRAEFPTPKASMKGVTAGGTATPAMAPTTGVGMAGTMAATPSAPVAPYEGPSISIMLDGAMPATPLAVAAADPIAEAPQLQWYVLPAGATSQYGPAVGEGLRAWIQEGRVRADAMVWRQDWTEWKRAGSVFPQLEPVGQAVVGGAPAAAPAIPAAAGALPTASGAIPMAAPVVPGTFPADPLSGLGARSEPIRAGHRAYRPRSNAGPIIAIVVLLLAMVPLSILVVKVVRDQFTQPPPASSPDKQE